MCYHRRDPVRLYRWGRMDIEGVRQSHEEVEQGPVVDGLGDLSVGPADIAQALDLFVGNPINGRVRVSTNSNSRRSSGLIGARSRSPSRSRRSGLAVLGSLQLQEPRMGAESLVASVQRRNVQRDHLVLSAGEGTVGKMEAGRILDGK